MSDRMLGVLVGVGAAGGVIWYLSRGARAQGGTRPASPSTLATSSPPSETASAPAAPTRPIATASDAQPDVTVAADPAVVATTTRPAPKPTTLPTSVAPLPGRWVWPVETYEDRRPIVSQEWRGSDASKPHLGVDIMFRVPGAVVGSGTIYPQAVERWRAIVRYVAPDVDIDFLLAWIQHESGGQPCAVGIANVETGLFQTFHPADDRHGATFAQLRTACDPAANRELRALTDAEKRLQVTTGINLVRACRASALEALNAIGAQWAEQDVYCLTKLVHALPAYVRPFLRAFAKQLGQPPRSWPEFRLWVRGLSEEAVIGVDRAVRPWASVAQRDRLFGLSERAGNAAGRRGLRFEVPVGVRVLAAADGRVWSVDRHPRGWTVVLDHGATGYATFYTHLAEVWLKPTQRAASGERVHAGQPLGLVGHDPLDAQKIRHLHFELWKGGPQSAIDPQPFMRGWEYLRPPRAPATPAPAPLVATSPASPSPASPAAPSRAS